MNKFKLSDIENVVANIDWASPFEDYFAVAINSEVALNTITNEPIYRVEIKLAKEDELNEAIILEFSTKDYLDIRIKVYKDGELVNNYVKNLTSYDAHDNSSLAFWINSRLPTLPDCLREKPKPIRDFTSIFVKVLEKLGVYDNALAYLGNSASHYIVDTDIDKNTFAEVSVKELKYVIYNFEYDANECVLVGVKLRCITHVLDMLTTTIYVDLNVKVTGGSDYLTNYKLTRLEFDIETKWEDAIVESYVLDKVRAFIANNLPSMLSEVSLRNPVASISSLVNAEAFVDYDGVFGHLADKVTTKKSIGYYGRGHQYFQLEVGITTKAKEEFKATLFCTPALGDSAIITFQSCDSTELVVANYYLDSTKTSLDGWLTTVLHTDVVRGFKYISDTDKLIVTLDNSCFNVAVFDIEVKAGDSSNNILELLDRP